MTWFPAFATASIARKKPRLAVLLPASSITIGNDSLSLNDSPTPKAAERSPEVFEYERVSIDDVRQIQETGNATAASAAADLIRTERIEPLRDATVRWVTRLPELTRPIMLSKRFPGIVNSIASLWSNRRESERLLANLLASQAREPAVLRAQCVEELRALVAEATAARERNFARSPPHLGTLRATPIMARSSCRSCR